MPSHGIAMPDEIALRRKRRLAMANKEDDWRNVDINELSEMNRVNYEAMKAAYRVYAEKKAAFENGMQVTEGAGLPNGLELKFGYMFGKLSVAIGPKREAKAVKAQSSGTLADWLAGRVNSGQRS